MPTHDRVLGWYSFQGTVFITHEIAEDSRRTASVTNHELTHQLMSTTTSHGFIQEALELCREQAWDEANSSRSENIDALRSLMFEESIFVHEATATYCGLVDYSGVDLIRELNRLPPFYREGYDLYREFFSAYDVGGLARYRMTRAIGCRAMQTAILEDWFVKELWRPKNLRAYLATPENRPNDRLRKIIDSLSDIGVDSLTAWCGGHIRSSDTFVLEPPLPPFSTDIEFHPLPPLQTAHESAARLLRILWPGRFEDASIEDNPADMTTRIKKQLAEIDQALIYGLCHPGNLEVAIQPPSFRSIPLDFENVNWARSADLVTVDRNIFERPVRHVGATGRHNVDAEAAKLFFWRPDYLSARECMVPLGDLRDFLEHVDPLRQLTICLTGQMPWAPHPGSHPADDNSASDVPDCHAARSDWLAPWTLGRRVMIYTGGTRAGFTIAFVFLKDRDAPLLMCRILTSRSWSLAVVRSSSIQWPVAVHPVMHSEWNLFKLLGREQFSMEEILPAILFGGDVGNCIRVLNFLRSFRGLSLPESDWQRVSDETAEAIMNSQEFADTPPGDVTNFRDKL